MSVENVYVIGSGKTEDQAKLDFVSDMMKKFPKEKGKYSVFIREPINVEGYRLADGSRESYIIRTRFSFEKEAI